jgi:hypothetical protein
MNKERQKEINRIDIVLEKYRENIHNGMIGTGLAKYLVNHNIRTANGFEIIYKSKPLDYGHIKPKQYEGEG